jgi:hypothetical protein
MPGIWLVEAKIQSRQGNHNRFSNYPAALKNLLTTPLLIFENFYSEFNYYIFSKGGV